MPAPCPRGPTPRRAGPGPRGTVRRGVVGRGQPAVAQARDPPQPGRRAPARNPDQRAGPLRRPRLQPDPAGGVELALEPGRVTVQQRAKHPHGLVKASPALLVPDAHGGVVVRRGPRPHPDDQATAEEDVDRGQGPGQLHGTAEHREGGRGGEGHVLGRLDERGQRGRAVEPRPAEQQMVVRAEVAVAEARRRPAYALSSGRDRGAPRSISGRWAPYCTSWSAVMAWDATATPACGRPPPGSRAAAPACRPRTRRSAWPPPAAQP